MPFNEDYFKKLGGGEPRTASEQFMKDQALIDDAKRTLELNPNEVVLGDRTYDVSTGEFVNEFKIKPEGVVYQYPIDMSNIYPGQINFIAYEVVPDANLDSLFSGLNTSYTKIRDLQGSRKNGIEGDQTTDPSVADQVKNKNDDIDAQIQSEITGAINSIGNLGGKETQPDDTIVGTVRLPMQRGVKFDDKANYNNVALGIIGGAARAGINPGQSVSNIENGSELAGVSASLAAQGVATFLGGAAGFLTAGFAGAIIGAVTGGNSGVGLSGAIADATRITSKPNYRTLFQDVDIRRFNFAFRMVATSEREAKEIKNIVKFFRENLYPDTFKTDADGFAYAYKFPNQFDIKIKSADPNHNPAFEIQRCYLENVSTTFNQTATSLAKGKYFIETDIQLSFAEITALDKSKIKAGY